VRQNCQKGRPNRRLAKAKRVYFVIEGCLKADAVLSSILAGDRPESVFSVPSVSLWKAEELRDFVFERLRGKQVIIIPVSDWVTNDDVRTQAFRVRETLGAPNTRLSMLVWQRRRRKS